jgi:predicted O-linked N-acetylglucosamine transferase (SPINDLY family)
MLNWIRKTFLSSLEKSDPVATNRQQVFPAQGHDAASTHRERGNGAMANGNLPEAIKQYQLALGEPSADRDLHRDLCYAFFLCGETAKAKEIARQGLSLLPADAFEAIDLSYYLGNLHTQDAEFEQAIQCFQTVVAGRPDFAEAHFNLGIAFYRSGRSSNALASFGKSIEINPNQAEPYNSMGVIHWEGADTQGAMRCFRRAVELNPASPQALNNLGNLLQEQFDMTEAMACLRQAIALDPNFSEAHFSLGVALKSQHALPEALAAFEDAFRLRADYAEARWAIALIKIQIHSELEHNERILVEACLQELDALAAWCEIHQLDAGKIGGMQPLFFLTSTDVNCTPILARYGNLCAHLMKRWYDRQEFPPVNRHEGNRIRVGIVSHDLHENPVWNATLRGWYQYFDPGVFEIHSFYLGTKPDAHTRYAESRSAHFTNLGGTNLKACIEAIQASQPDLLLYPAIGGATTFKLASLRLAPHQVTTWGHPEGSGLPTIDYFISAEDFESPSAQDHYVEKLVCLPHIGSTYLQLEHDNLQLTFEGSEIQAGKPLLLCPGMPYKYAPKNDHLLVQIARALPDCQLVFFTALPVEYSEQFKHRLKLAFEAANLPFHEHCAFLPWQNRSAFFALMRHAHVFLDTIGYSGFNTVIQAVQCNLPIVTKEGQFLRGRFGSGILKKLGLDEFVAASDSEYVDLAVKLVRDSAYRLYAKEKMTERVDALFGDPAPSIALSDMLKQIASGA